jgi:hypothetical protein
VTEGGSISRYMISECREPYWAAPLSRGRIVGLRKIDMLRATWIARFRDDAGKQKYKSIGIVTTEFGFDQAKAVAAEWFKLQESGVKTTEVRTVADACKAYVKSLTLTNGAAAAAGFRGVSARKTLAF